MPRLDKCSRLLENVWREGAFVSLGLGDVSDRSEGVIRRGSSSPDGPTPKLLLLTTPTSQLLVQRRPVQNPG